jgi:histidinol phosphatase-like PHP family hydrolase
MIDLHMHTIHSDGELIPAELVSRAEALGYEALAITDHVDRSNIEPIIKDLLKFTKALPAGSKVKVIVGVELTHLPPADIEPMVKYARELGAELVLCHGESIVEPVPAGTNLAAIEAGVDILAHPGLITEVECRRAKEKNVYLEISARKGHSLTNGHVGAMAKRFDVKMVINSDAHAPQDILNPDFAKSLALGAGIDEKNYEEMRNNAKDIITKISI